MKKFLYCNLLLIFIISISGAAMAQGTGGSGGASMGSGSKSIISAAGLNSNKIHSFNHSNVVIDAGTPTIGNEDGIYIWLDQSEIWQVRWHGEPGQIVWVRLQPENPISNVTSIGTDVKTEKRGDSILTITGVTSNEPTGVSFKCETSAIDFDAKWNMGRDTNKIYISDLTINPSSLPFGVNATIYKGVDAIKGSTKTSKMKNTTTSKGGSDKGLGTQ